MDRERYSVTTTRIPGFGWRITPSWFPPHYDAIQDTGHGLLRPSVATFLLPTA